MNNIYKNNIPKILVLILAIFIIKGLLLILLIPPWEAPDEPGHVSYVIYLYNNKKIPSSSRPFILQSINDSFLKIKKIIKTSQEKNVESNKKIELFEKNKNYSPISANLASHPPLYYLYLVPFYKFSLPLSSYSSFILLRFGSLLLGIGVLLLSFYITKNLFEKSNTIPALVTLIVSLQPMFSFITSIVNNDIMVVFIFLLFIFTLLNLLKSKDIPLIKLLFLTIVTGIAPLVKPQLFVLIIIFLIYLYTKQKKLGRNTYTLLSITSIVPVLIWFFMKYSYDGVLFVNYAVQNIQTNPASIWTYPLEFITGNQPIGIFMSFWGFFGWLDVPMPKWSYLIYLCFILISLLGYWLGRKKINCNNITNIQSIKFLILSFFLYVLTIVVFDLQSYTLSHKFAIQGRYLSPILPLLIIFLINGILFFSKSIQKKLIILIIIFFIIGQLIMFLTINNYYYGSFFLNLLINSYKI